MPPVCFENNLWRNDSRVYEPRHHYHLHYLTVQLVLENLIRTCVPPPRLQPQESGNQHSRLPLPLRSSRSSAFRPRARSPQHDPNPKASV